MLKVEIEREEDGRWIAEYPHCQRAHLWTLRHKLAPR